jgi:hypothetical protein
VRKIRSLLQMHQLDKVFVATDAIRKGRQLSPDLCFFLNLVECWAVWTCKNPQLLSPGDKAGRCVFVSAEELPSSSVCGCPCTLRPGQQLSFALQSRKS